MTPDQLDAIEARANAATKGPWLVGGIGMELADFGMNDDGSVSTIHVPPTSDAACSAKQPSADAEFCAAARTDVPLLVARVRALEAWLAESEMLVARSADVLRNDEGFVHRAVQQDCERFLRRAK